MGFGGLYVSVSGLQSSKHSLNTVSHNISNANNPYYVRQSALHADNFYKRVGTNVHGNIQQGTGVHIGEIRQIRDGFLDIQLRRELPSFGYYLAKSETLADVEGVFNEITDSGMQKVMDDMWHNWDELSKDPGSLTKRALVHEAAVAFTDTVNHISNQLSDIQINMNKELTGKVEEVNSIIDRVADLNKAIKIGEAEGEHISMNDVRDERNALLDRLHQLLPVKTYEDEFGGVVIHLQGQDMVNGSYVNKPVLKQDISGFGQIYWKDKPEDPINLGGMGEIGGFIDVRDKSVAQYKDQVDIMVTTIASKVNQIHVRGKGLGEGAKAGIPFFVYDGFKEADADDLTDPNKLKEFNGKINASNIKINPALADLNKIATSESGKENDGSLAKEIFGLLESKDLFEDIDLDKYPSLKEKDLKLEDIRINEFYNKITTGLALERQEAINRTQAQGFLIKSIDEKRAGLSSVSLDEEMADMLKFQYAYTANSRVFNAIDEMIEIVVNRVGLVGR